eukprot:GHVL01018889.1.p1 GENE.GHVL01018889.1~~GHVL01018889.1.p1  ORF type:complete len:110 (+),score=20.33 GHVL01018889.1:62-391(+)
MDTVKLGKIEKYSHPDLSDSADAKFLTIIKLATPLCSLLKLEMKCGLKTRLTTIHRAIQKHHGNSINNIIICLHRFHPSLVITDLTQTLGDLGVTHGGGLLRPMGETLV